MAAAQKGGFYTEGDEAQLWTVESPLGLAGQLPPSALLVVWSQLPWRKWRLFRKSKERLVTKTSKVEDVI